jgi:polyisoprenoid-binding protein YceI
MTGIFAALFATSAEAATYQLDQAHTALSFKIKHLISWTQGTFNSFEGNFTYDPEKPEIWKVDVTMQTDSIDTRNDKRDQHLRSKDFFEVETYPTITFNSTGVSEVTEKGFKLSGVLNMHGVERPVVLDVESHGVGQDPWGNVRVGFTATGEINRKDFNINWNETLDTGGLLLGEEVKIILEVEGIQQ